MIIYSRYSHPFRPKTSPSAACARAATGPCRRKSCRTRTDLAGRTAVQSHMRLAPAPGGNCAATQAVVANSASATTQRRRTRPPRWPPSSRQANRQSGRKPPLRRRHAHATTSPFNPAATPTRSWDDTWFNDRCLEYGDQSAQPMQLCGRMLRNCCRLCRYIGCRAKRCVGTEDCCSIRWLSGVAPMPQPIR